MVSFLKILSFVVLATVLALFLMPLLTAPPPTPPPKPPARSKTISPLFTVPTIQTQVKIL
jgi:hypothetical protein